MTYYGVCSRRMGARGVGIDILPTIVKGWAEMTRFPLLFQEHVPAGHVGTRSIGGISCYIWNYSVRIHSCLSWKKSGNLDTDNGYEHVCVPCLLFQTWFPVVCFTRDPVKSELSFLPATWNQMRAYKWSVQKTVGKQRRWMNHEPAELNYAKDPVE